MIFLEILLNMAAFLVGLLFLARLLGANPFNPIIYTLYNLLSPIMAPFKLILPTIYRFDLVLFSFVLGIKTTSRIIQFGWDLFLYQVGLASITVLLLLIDILFYALFLGVIKSWVAPGGQHPAALLIDDFNRPILTPIRRLFPISLPLDFSPMIAILILFYTQFQLHRLLLFVQSYILEL